VNVSVTLFADLRRFGPKGHEGSLNVSLEDGATAEEMLTAMGVPEDETIRGEITVGLNGELGQRDSVLNEADEILLFSPMAGG
jgi:molybdopterin converting factor small subunit